MDLTTPEKLNELLRMTDECSSVVVPSAQLSAIIYELIDARLNAMHNAMAASADKVVPIPAVPSVSPNRPSMR